jgi:glycine/D-amino acid oxidase-like deaminating enzyme
MISSSLDHLDCMVIGAGLAGLTSAIELSRKGYKVALVYDGRDKSYATRATHGISTIKGILESDTDLFALKLKGHRGFPEWLLELEREIGQQRPAQVFLRGVDESFNSQEQFKKEFGRIYRRDFIGAKQVQWKKPNDESFAMVHYPGDWWINPRYLLDIYWRVIRQQNVVSVNTPVEQVLIKDDLIHVKTADHRWFGAKKIIICSGARTPGLLSLSNIDLPERLFAVAGYTFTGRTSMSKTGCLVKGTSGLAHVDCELFWGSTSEPARELSDTNQQPLSSANEDQVKELGLKLLQSLAPSFSKQAITDLNSLWGVRVRTRTRAPLVKCVYRNRSNSVWVNTGYYKSGIILSWLKAKDLADSIGAELRCSASH